MFAQIVNAKIEALCNWEKDKLKKKANIKDQTVNTTVVLDALNSFAFKLKM